MLYPVDKGDEEGSNEDDTANGDVFEGHMEHGKKQGKGVYTWKGGCIYSGNYEENRRSGHGVMTLPDGSRYEGGGFLRVVCLRRADRSD